MKIIVDAVGIDAPGGGRTSILNLFKTVFAIDPINDYVIILSKSEPQLDQFKNVKQLLIPIKNRFLSRVYLQFAFYKLLNEADIVHFSKNLGVFGLSTNQVVTVHDLTTVLYPDLFPMIDHVYWRTLEKITLRAAKQIITVSKDAAKDIESFYKIKPNRIRVIYHGCDQSFRPSNIHEIKRVTEKYNLPQVYFVHVGRIDRKKNLTTLVKAFAKLKSRIKFDGKLVLVGEIYKKSPDQELPAAISRLGLTNDVLFTGRIPDEDLPAIYSGAFASIFPSIHEGFGLVALEAMACGSPLICHKAGAVSEVVGDAALVLERIDEDNLADTMERLTLEPAFRETLRCRGIERAKLFTWEAAAQKLLDTYAEVVKLERSEII